jgi:hypothetical protein
MGIEDKKRKEKRNEEKQKRYWPSNKRATGFYAQSILRV